MYILTLSKATITRVIGSFEQECFCRYSFKATYPLEYVGRPILHYHYKVDPLQTTIIRLAEINLQNVHSMLSVCQCMFPLDKALPHH